MRGQTFSNIVQRTIKMLSQVYGTSVQRYSEPRIQEMVQSRFEMLFDEYWWHQFKGSGTFTLNGTTGEVTETLTSLIKRYEDVQAVFITGMTVPLAQLPTKFNAATLASSSPKFIGPSATKVFKVYPVASTGTIEVHYRTLPTSFTDDSVVDFDDFTLIYAACMDFAIDDATNELQIQKFDALFTKRLEQLVRMQNQIALPINRNEQITLTDWTTYP